MSGREAAPGCALPYPSVPDIGNQAEGQESQQRGEFQLDEPVEGLRSRKLDDSPYTFVRSGRPDAKVREGGRTVKDCLIAAGVNADRHREIIGVEVISEDGARWLAFLRGLVARGLTGTATVTSGDHVGLPCPSARGMPLL